jgi:hypothetical protein
MTGPINYRPGAMPEAREALPRPCLGCGAPMTAVAPVAGLHGNPTLTCRYCGNTETMPAEAAAQDRFLRLRLMQVRRSREALEAPLKSFEMVRQSWAIGLVFFVAIGGWQLWQALSVVGKAPIESTLFATLGASVVVGIIFGYVGMSRAFRGLVQPLLQARPPAESGLSARCRSCGGELPNVRATQVQCGFCGANNFLDAGLARDVSNLLASEQAEYQRRAHGGHPPDGSAYQQPAKAFYRWTVAGGAATFIVAVVITFALLR